MLERLKNPGTIVAVVSATLLVLTNVGVEVDNEQIMIVVKAVCSIGVTLGILNNPDTPGLDLPFIDKK